MTEINCLLYRYMVSLTGVNSWPEEDQDSINFSKGSEGNLTSIRNHNRSQITYTVFNGGVTTLVNETGRTESGYEITVRHTHRER